MTKPEPQNSATHDTRRQASQVEGVLVEIFGEKYRIGGDPKQVQQVAAYVDAKMKEIASKNGRMPKAQVAMLAAMEVAADLFKVMSERKVFTDRAHESVERLTRLVEDRATLVDTDSAATDRAAAGDGATRPSADRVDRLLADRLLGDRATRQVSAELVAEPARGQYKPTT